MTAFLSTISKQFIFARGMVIALFAGLFILTACGGGVGGGDLIVNLNVPPNLCNDPFSTGCLLDGANARKDAIDKCRSALERGSDTCAEGVPELAVTCSRNPFDTKCTEKDYTDVVRSDSADTLSDLRTARISDCKTQLTGDTLCGGAVLNVCGTVANATDSLLFSEAFCHRAEYNDRRGVLVADCLASLQDGNTCAESVPDLAVTCLRNPFDATCIEQDYTAVVRSDSAVTLSKLRDDRISDCKTRLTGDTLCGGAVLNVCGTVANAMDSLLFTDDFCDRAEYNPSRGALVTDCLESLQGGNTCDSSLVPQAVINCITDFGTDCSDTQVGEALARTNTTRVALESQRKSFCEGNLENDLLCEGIITAQCDSLVGESGAMRMGLVNNPLCLGVRYGDARIELFRDCNDADTQNNAGCTQAVIDCVTNPFADTLACRNSIYDGRRADECFKSPSVSGQCATASLVADYCANNLFSKFAGCSGSGYNDDRVTYCIDGTNNRKSNCKNTLVFADAQIACFANPYGAGCDTVLDDDGDTSTDTPAQVNRLAYCGSGAAGVVTDNSLCDGAVADVCFKDAFNAFCFADSGYQATRESTCRADSEDIRCPATITSLCTANPFTQTTGGSPTNLCTGGDDTRVALIARCGDADNSNNAGCDASVTGGVSVADCVADPHRAGCDDPLFNSARDARNTFCAMGDNSDNIQCANARVGNPCISNPFGNDIEAVACDATTYANPRYDYCEGEAPKVGLCGEVVARICVADAGEVNPRANPFAPICRLSGVANLDTEQTNFCNVAGRTGLGNCDTAVQATCGENPFDAVCFDGSTYAPARATLIKSCEDNPNSNPDCDKSINNAVTVGVCIDNLFTAGCGVGFESLRVEHCSDTATTFSADCTGRPEATLTRTALIEICRANDAASGCDGFANGGTTGATIADCAANPFNRSNDCNSNQGFQTERNARRTLCSSDATIFNSLCDGLDPAEGLNVEGARIALAEACLLNQLATGCDSFIDGEDGLTVAQCSANPLNTANGCNDNAIFMNVRNNLTTRCNAPATQFESLCDGFDNIDNLRLTFCTTGEGSFDDRCDENYSGQAADARKAFIVSCRDDNPAPSECASLIIADGVTIADCIKNPYHRVCYGTEDKRNPDFIDEVTARDALCSSADTFFSSLCNNGIFGGLDVDAARLAYCNNPATTFDANCNETAYEGTDDTRETLIMACRGATVDAPVAGCEQVVANQQDVGRMVNDCIDVTGGDPYQTGCSDSLFEDDRDSRLELCTQGANARDDAVCVNAIAEHSCIADPYSAACLGESDFDNARTLRRDYCKDEVKTSTDSLCNSSLIGAICDGVEPDDNPFSTLCGNPAVVTTAQQNFCNLAGPSANNSLCSSNEAEVCPKNPFNSSFGVRRLVCNGVDYADDRIRQCSDGTQNDATLCNTPEIAPVVCKGTGVSANPFAEFCVGSLANAGLADINALNDEKDKFTEDCAKATPSVYTSCNLAQTTFCVADGTYARPFAATCNDAALSETIGGIRASFCGTGNAGTENNADCVGAIGADCVNNPFGAACVSPSVAELRTLRASYCNSFGTADLALADALCTSDTAEAVCKDGYGGFDASPFDLICGLDATYDTERTTACLGAPMTADNGGEGRCRDLIMNFCGDSTASDGANPFNSNCTSGDYGDYENQRRTACRVPSNPHECGDTIQAFCGTTASPLIDANNVNDDLCAGADLEVARGKACAGIEDAMIREDKCGREDGTGDLNAYCQTDIGKQNAPICPIENGKFAVTTCTNTNPFASVCDGNASYIAARSSRCVSSRLAQNSVALPDGVTDSDCEAAEMLICDGGTSGALTVTGNLFDPICGSDYEQERAEACGPDADISVNSECPTIVGSFCGIDGNEFSSACTEDSVAQGYRDSKCLATATDEDGSGNDCSDAYVRICTANPFSTKNDGANASICNDTESTTTYADSRKTACENDNTAKGANSGTCAPVIIVVCGAKDTITKGGALFTESLCTVSGDTTYDKSRRLACENNPDVNGASGCDATVELTCGVLGTPDVAKLFSDSSLCGATYNADRETACSAGGGAEKGDCTNTVTRICVTEDKVFNSVCLHKDDVVELRTNTCKTAYRAGCDTHTQFTEFCRATPLASATKVQCSGLGTTNDQYIADFCGDVTNSANAFTDGCENATYTTTTHSDQLDKACAEGGSAADDACRETVVIDNENKVRADRYCKANPYAVLTGCTELGEGVIAEYRSDFCTANPGDNNCSDNPAQFCPVRPFDSECVDESSSTTYADARKGRADKCRDPSQRTGLDCSAVDTCNARPYGTSAGFTPDNGTALTCATDPAFDGAKTELIGRCALADKALTDAECINAIADGATCLTDPYGTGCDTQLLNAGNVTTAKTGRNAYCVTDGADSSLCSSSALDVVCTASESPFATLCVAAGAGATYRAERVAYCEDSTQTFYTRCDEFVGEPGVESARGAFCALNGNTVNKGNGDETFADGILFNAVCNSLPLATTARVNACKVDADAFLFKCDVVQGESDVIAARARVCAANTLNVSRGAVDTSDILFNETLCGINLAGVRDARVEYCEDSAQTFYTRCDEFVAEPGVESARGAFCALNGNTVNKGNGDETFADGILFNEVCNSLPLATDERVNVCKVDADAFLTKCDVVASENDVMTARAGVCIANTPDVIRGAVDTSDILFNETLCTGLEGVTAARVDFCDEDATTFLSKCDIVEDELAVMTARGRVCARKPGTLIRGAGVDNITGDVLFNEVCNDLPLATAERVNVCKADADSFLAKCDVVQGESDVMTARARVCVANMPDVSRGDGNTIPIDVLFDTLCNGLDGVTTARTSACLENDANRDCTGVFGDGFTAWVGVTNDGKTTINAGGADAGDVDANFIRVQIKTDGTLNLGGGITPDNQTIVRLSDTGLSSDTDSGFALASANFGDEGGQDNINLYVGLLHTTTDLGGVASLDTTATATWHGSLAILQQNDDRTLASYNSDFALTVDFDNNSLRGGVLNVGNVVGVDFALVGARFDRTSGLISGDVTLSKATRTPDGGGADVPAYSAARTATIYPSTTTTGTTTATLRGVIGTEGAVATFAGVSSVTNTFGDIVGGFAVSPVPLAQSDCLTGNPFADGCATKVGCSGSGDVTMCDLPVGQILTAQLAACTTGKLPDGTDTPDFESNCMDDVNLTEIDPAGDGTETRVRSVLSGVLCSLDHENANPLAKICDSITDDIFYTDGIISGNETQHEANLRKTRAGIESACNNGSPRLEQGGRTATIHENVCRRVALAAAKDAYDTAVIVADREAKCVLRDLPTLFGNECEDGASLILRREYCYNIANAFDTTYCIVSDVVADGVDISTVRGNQARICRFPDTSGYPAANTYNCDAQHIKDALCGATFTEVSNPFHVTCAGYASIESTRSDFAFKCVNNRNRITNTLANCMMGNFAPCITNPFATDASVPNKEHTGTQTCASSPAFSSIQGEIIASCRQGDIIYSSNCGHASTHTCPAFVTARSPDLFIDAICRVNTDYDTARRDILDNCGTMGDCDTFRVRHPDDTNSDYLTTDGRLIDCQDPALAVLAGCVTVLNRPTTAAVLEGFDRHGAKVSTQGDSSKEQLLDTPSGGVDNEFLIGQLDTAGYLDTNGFVGRDGTTVSSVYNASVGFTLGQHDEASDDSRIAGVAYFAGRDSASPANTEVRYFAGLLPYTDFGVALPTLPQAANVDVSADWTGRFGWVVYDATDAAGYTAGTDTGFTLTVNFTARTISGTATRSSDSLAFAVNGVYDDKGLIDGDIEIGGTRYTGQLIGAIGEFGAAAAFHASRTGVGGAAGGFAVYSNNGEKFVDPTPLIPTIPASAGMGTYGLWAFDIQTRDSVIQQLIGGTGLLQNLQSTGALSNEALGLGGGIRAGGGVDTTTPFRLSLEGSFLGGDTNDGVAYFAGTRGGLNNYHAGLFASTDVGALLPATPTEIVLKWTGGSIDYVVGVGDTTLTHHTGNFTLSLNLNARTFEAESFTGITGIAVSGSWDAANGLIADTSTIRVSGVTGTLTGVVGEQGAIGAFVGSSGTTHYAGGFVANAPMRTATADPAPLTMPSSGSGTYARWAFDIQTRDSVIKEESGGFGYLRGLTKDGALTRTTLGADRLGLDGKIVVDTLPERNGGETPADSIPFRLSLDGSVDDGVAYFTGTRDGVKNYHTGLFITTNVGAVLPPESDSNARVHWDGTFGYVSRFNNDSFNANGTFRLKLNLNAKTFTIDRVVFMRGNDGFEFSGGWNDFGVITGGISSVNTVVTGTLTGVIGMDGAVGAFWGNQAAGNGGYAGGFVASGDIDTTISAVPTPTSGKADYSYWAFDIQTRDGVIEQLISGIGYLQKLSKDGVLSAKTLDGGLLRTNGGVDLTTPYRLSLADTDDGVAYFSGVLLGDANYHAGLFTSTDVGDELNTFAGARIAYWNGELGIILGNDADVTHHTGSFTLKVNMSSRSFRGLDFASSIAGIGFTGGWNAQTGVITNGVISRTTDDGTISGTLTGLIGEAGAVAAFRSVNTGADQWVGGFVATASVLGTYQAYQSYYDYYSTRTGNAQLHTTTVAGGVTGFVAGRADELVDGRVVYSLVRGASCSLSSPCFEPFAVRANGVASSTNGFIMTHGTHAAYGDRYRVGILPTTDLGLPSSTGVANWNGNFYISRKLGADGNPAATPFVLNVDFGAGTMSSALVPLTSSVSMRISALFGNNPHATLDGLARGLPGGFGGAVYFAGNKEDTREYRVDLTGLIGAQGAIGIFSGRLFNQTARDSLKLRFDDPGVNFINRIVGGFEAFSGAAVPTPSSPTAAAASNIYSAEVIPTNYVTVATRSSRLLPASGTSVNGSDFEHFDSSYIFIADKGLGIDSSLDHCGGDEPICFHKVYTLNARVSANAFYLFRAQAPSTDTRNNNWYRAGILHGTNLGAPPTTGNAVFNGKLYISNQVDGNGHPVPLDIRFNVNFGTRRITQPTRVNLATAGHSLALRSTTGFKPNGVLFGNMLYYRTGENEISMALNGLIGTNAVLGVFHSSAFKRTLGVILGGFWASDSTPHFIPLPLTGLDFGTVDDFSEDMVFGNTAGTSCTIAAPCFNTTVRLGGDIDSPNGFGLFHGHHETKGSIYRAGLLLDTDLGAASTTGSASWTGSIYTSNNLGADGNPVAVPITLGVNFVTGRVRSLATTVVDGDAATKETIAIEGVFGTHADAPAAEGVLGGVINYKVGTAEAIPLDLIGSVGKQGVLGVFHGRVANRPLVGGFEAMYVPPAGSITNSAIVYNRQGAQILDSAPFRSNTVASVENVSNVPITLSRGLTDDDLGGFYSFVSRNTVEITQQVAYYTGLLDGVAEKVGGVLPATFSDGMTTATWSGTFAMYYGSGRGFTFTRDGAGSFSHQALELTVNLGSKSFRAPTQFSYGGSPVTAFNGKWNEFGAITESQFFTRGVPGTIQGFIGVNGIVGVVASTVPNANVSYAGGFIAKP